MFYLSFELKFTKNTKSTSVFTFKTEPFGKISQIKLINTHTGEYVAILADCGCAINSLVLKKNDKLFDLIDGSETYEQLLLHGLSEYKGSFLFPFPNRLKGGEYVFQNKTYNFDCNDCDNRPNALHGTLYDQKFNITRFEAFEDRAEVDFLFKTSGIYSAYPFYYSVLVQYILHATDGLSINTVVTNHGNSTMPVGFGWHPYFKTTGKIDDILLHFPNCENIELDVLGIPTGTILPSKLFKFTDSVNTTNLDDCFRVITSTETSCISLIDSSNNVRVDIWQQNGTDKYNFFQTYIPPHRNSIAIEPMTCAPDSFNNGMGLIQLQSLQTTASKWGVKLA